LPDFRSPVPAEAVLLSGIRLPPRAGGLRAVARAFSSLRRPALCGIVKYQ
jgi:hypothetical protein